MEKLKFNITIDAPREKVWDILWSEKTYNEWTSAFSEGSHAVTDWKEGSKILFLDGNGEGMVSKVARNIPNEFMSIEHLGYLMKGVEDTTSDEVKKWSGAHENYTLKSAGGKTELNIDMDVTSEYKDMFQKMWPNALDNVKRIAESN